MTITRSRVRFSVVAALLACAVLGGPATVRADTPAAPDDIVNPHFSGKDCGECHDITSGADPTGANLLFGGDDVALCSSCHQPGKAKTDVHPVNVLAGETRTVAPPEDLPLSGNRVTCLTCHDVKIQCHKDPVERFENYNFLRGGPYPNPADMCFRCHKRQAYSKTNPHEQVGPSGELLENQCLYCHLSLPDPEAARDIADIAFKTATSTFCIACHGDMKSSHPAGADHLLELPPGMRSDWEAAQDHHAVDLPLYGDMIFCGTCHNPHAPGVIDRTAAAAGADTPDRLRLDRDTALCVACHADKASVQPLPSAALPPVDYRHQHTYTAVPEYHRSFIEKKCRACHAITREAPERPVVYRMCFQSGCHDASILHATYKHGEALSANCLLCHNQHGSQYGAHIVNDQQMICGTCHPLLGKPEGATHPPGEEDLHAAYYGLFETIYPDRESTCSFCHAADHRGDLQEHGITGCYRCHSTIKELISGRPGKPRDVHDTFQQDTCTACHDPHSSPYPFLLLDKPETYTQP